MDRLSLEAEPLIRDPSLWKTRLAMARPALAAAEQRGLVPTPWFVEFCAYWGRANRLQEMNLGVRPRGPVGDQLQEVVPIYDTTRRRYAGFSNVLEQLFYGEKAPKFDWNLKKGWACPKFAGSTEEFLYLCLIHRCMGSGASFEGDHGWRNTIVPEVASVLGLKRMAETVRRHKGPSCTSIGNQPPAVRKIEDLGDARNSLQYYLGTDGVELTRTTYKWLKKQKGPVPIKWVMEAVLNENTRLGQKRFVFVLTAWAMDIAEYFPTFVDPNSDCYHGANARESWERLFHGSGQKLYDGACRLMADLTQTYPMDVEDVACDAVRWIENYLPKNHKDKVIWNSSSLRHDQGRQPDG